MTDSPDFAPSVAPVPATYIATAGPFAAGGSWGPANVRMPGGGSYHLNIRPLILADYAITDLGIGHFDPRGVAAYQDYYGGILLGEAGGGGFASAGSAIVRGNLYGTSLQLIGNLATSAYINAVIPTGGFTATGITIDVYWTPFALSDPQPKVICATADLASLVSNTPQVTLALANELNVPAASGSLVNPVLPYSGPATLEITQTGIAAAANAQLVVNEYTVGNGSAAPWARRRVKGLATAQYYSFPVYLAPLLRTWQFINADAANAATVDMLLTGNSTP